MRPSLLLTLSLASAVFTATAASASAQSAPDSAAARLAVSDSTLGPSPSVRASTPSASADAPPPMLVPPSDSASKSNWAWFRHYPWNGVNVWAGSSVQTRSAAHNELLTGFLRIVGVQITRDLVRGDRFRLAYVGEILPAMFVQSSASTRRTQRLVSNALTTQDSINLARYLLHDSFGVGVAPFGLEFTTHLTRNVNFIMNTTAGGVLFNHIVPYGFGTKPNFTVSPGAALQWQGTNRAGIALGYTLHHLSNMGFGRANPGMNSHVFYVRVTRVKKL